MSVDFSLNSNSQIGWLLILRCALCWVADAVARPTPPATSDFKPRILNTTLHATFEIRIIARAHRLQIFHMKSQAPLLARWRKPLRNPLPAQAAWRKGGPPMRGPENRRKGGPPASLASLLEGKAAMDKDDMYI